MFTLKEIDAIRFYQGDIRKRDKDGRILENETNEGFYGTPSAYRTINCLMYEGIENEEERIKEGNGKLVPNLFLEIEKIVEVYSNIYSAMCKNAFYSEGVKKKIVYRTERRVSVDELKKGYTISFTSTSKKDKPEGFLLKKSDLTLLNIVFSPKIPHLDFQKVLGREYLFEQQEEILLPPFLEIGLEELELTEEEKEYRDIYNRPPYAKYLVWVKGVRNSCPEAESTERLPLTEERNRKAVEILTKLVGEEALTDEEKEEYCSWKQDVRAVIWKEFRKIGQQYIKGESMERREVLLAEVRKILSEYNEKRKKYKNKIRIYNLVLIVANTIPLAFMALSFVDSVQTMMKITAVITSVISIFLSQMLRVEVYDIKLMQRSKIYLDLCDLNREMKYEIAWSREVEEKYISKFRDIMKEDTAMSLQNLQIQTKNMEKMYQYDMERRDSVVERER